VVDESRSEGERQFALKVPDCTVDEGGWNGNGKPPEGKINIYNYTGKKFSSGLQKITQSNKGTRIDA
jgi:hypothetical protein